MASLTTVERKIFEDLLNMSGGYVLDFTNETFADFFRDYGVDIKAERFKKNGDSKAKRMRAFWRLESDETVGRALEGLLDYINAIQPDGAGAVRDRHRAIANRLLGKNPPHSEGSISEEQFLRKHFGDIDLRGLDLDRPTRRVLQQRLDEAQLALAHNMPLSAVFLCGSTLEGLLLDRAKKSPKKFNQARSAPSVEVKPRQFHEWSLSDLINVASEVGEIEVDVKRFSHALRDFRNYIHPNEQLKSNFDPSPHTARISWQVLRAAIAYLSGDR